METIGWLSILPPVVAIVLAIKTREVYISLATFVWLGWTIMNSWNPVLGLVDGVNTFLAAITEPGNAKTLVFSALIGGIITLTQASGGMEGFTNWVERRGLGQNRRTVRLFAIGTSMSLFLESNFGLLVAGSVS
ncbi:MAG: sodium:solute symporter, partial [Gemmatimonadetes bacterium]|nr:sodium:solute symporter [Gemmatimonadota bacterium]